MPPVTYAALIECGWTRHAIREAIGRGSIRRLPRGAQWARNAPRYDVVECLRQVLRHHDVETSLIVLESACNLLLVSERTVAELVADCPKPVAEQLARFDARAESGSETRVRHFLVRRGYLVRPQVRIPGVGRVDLLVVESLIVECDSHAHHTGETHYRADRSRDLHAAAQGYRVVRLTWEQVFLTWTDTQALLLQHLRTRRYRRPPLAG
jgi:very-short-patch-repair endonuclease